MKKNNKKSNSLKIVIKGEYFDAIASKKKTVEYRDESDLWESRLYDKEAKKRAYDTIEFINGYNKDARRMIVEYKGFKTRSGVYQIQLGRIVKKPFV